MVSEHYPILLVEQGKYVTVSDWITWLKETSAHQPINISYFTSLTRHGHDPRSKVLNSAAFERQVSQLQQEKPYLFSSRFTWLSKLNPLA